MKVMRTVMVAVALAATVAPATAQDRPATEQARQRAREEAQRQREQAAQERRARLEERRGAEFADQFTRTVRLGRNGTFDLSNVSGDVVITGGGGDDVRIDARKHVRARDEADAKALLQGMEIQVSERSGLVEVRTEFPRRRNWSGGVDYTIALPNGANVAVRTVNGDLRLTNVRGELRAETVSGDVIAASVGRVRSLKTVSGDLQVTDAQGDDVALQTVSGDVIVRNARGRSIELEAVSGDLRFIDVEFDRANLRTISGDIEYAGRLARSGRYDLQSHSGDIRLSPVGNTGFDLDASTFSGDVRSDFQLGGSQVTAPAAPRRGNRTMRGTFGDASAILTLRSFNGDVILIRR
jgi:DUF4097 and DUF4098 domain-containing protein YvlB